MPETTYKIFHNRTAENIKFEVTRLRESILKTTNQSDQSDNLEFIETLLNEQILDFKTTNPSKNQLATRADWHDFLINKNKLSFNECLLILLGINPIHANRLDSDLFKTKLNDVTNMKKSLLNLIFFQRVENHLLRERFQSNSINKEEFIKWAMDYKYLRKIED